MSMMSNKDVTGDINYVTGAEDSSSLWYKATSITTTKRSNFEQTPVLVTIHDLRDKEHSFNLDTNGFEVAKYNGFMQEEFDDESETQTNHYEEISNFLKKHLAASRVIIYDYCFRPRGSPLNETQRDHHHREPVKYPHVDIDALGARSKIEKVLGKEAGEKALQHRVQIINVWRPLGPHPITKYPLTLCDYRSTDPNKDAHQVTLYTSLVTTTSYTMSRDSSDAHKWYYLSEMKSDEMFLFKIFETKPDVAQYAFHTSFNNENVSTPHMDEKSIELRCLIIYDDEEEKNSC